jgi:hypothetical protein
MRRPAWRISVAVLSVLVCLLASPRPAIAQSQDDLIRQADAAGAKGLPVTPLKNKIREGFAKGHSPKQIEAVVNQMVQNLEAADRIARDVEPGAAAAAREGAVTLLADALGSGLTTDEIRELRRQAQTASSQDLAGAAKGLSFIKDARLPVNEGTAVMSEAVRQRFRAYEMQDLGREIKRREADYRAGRVTLQSLREAIAKGARPETLLRDSRAATPERPAATRPTTTTDRPERTTVPTDRPQRPVDRPSTPTGERTR